MKLKLIVAMCKNEGIGYRNTIPWNIKKDLLYFSNKTCGEYGKYMRTIKNTEIDKINDKNIKKNAVIMGKNTWLSLPKYPEPLKNRDNIILSSSIPESIAYSSSSDLIIHFSSISHIMSFCISPGSDPLISNEKHRCYENDEKHEKREINLNSIVTTYNSLYDEVWIIGGTQIYNVFVNENMKINSNILIDEFCITYIDKYYECDTFFPRIENMNLYYISSFSKCESIDDKTGLRMSVYYIVFTLIEWDNTKYIQKKYVENINTLEYIGDVERYYYYTINDKQCEYITNDNADLFMWCITKC
jgi:dihydrofolate reductase